MDALTARKMSTMGLNATKPLLPPVHNMGIIHLKQPLTHADEKLHNARLALKRLEEAQEQKEDDPTIHRLELALHSAMEELQEKEQEYFAQRYVSHNKHVLYGWQNRVTLFLQEVVDMTREQLQSARESQLLGPMYSDEAMDCIETLYDMSRNVMEMNEKFVSKDGSWNAYNVPLHVFKTDIKELRPMRDEIRGLKQVTEDLSGNNPFTFKENSLRLTTAAYETAKALFHVAENMMNKKWDMKELRAHVDDVVW